MKTVWDELEISNSSKREQAETGIGEFADTIWMYFKELVDRGFTRQEALYLTDTFMKMGMQQDKK